jgi:hypothetical protein
MSPARRKPPSRRVKELTERTRREGRELSRRRRNEARKLRPVVAPVRGFMGWIAPYITGALMWVIKLLAALLALLAEAGGVAGSWLVARIRGIASATARWTQENVTPLSTVAFVGIAAAIGLAVSQFFDYHGVAVDAPGYAGEIGSVANVPIVGTETAGSAHLWVLLPVAALALLFSLGAYRGSGRFAAGMVVCGVVGIAVALAIDLPQGLDVGREGLAFYGAQAQLLGGFWVEITASATLILCGCLLPLYSRGAARPRKRPARRSRTEHREVGGIPPGLQAES